MGTENSAGLSPLGTEDVHRLWSFSSGCCVGHWCKCLADVWSVSQSVSQSK